MPASSGLPFRTAEQGFRAPSEVRVVACFGERSFYTTHLQLCEAVDFSTLIIYKHNLVSIGVLNETPPFYLFVVAHQPHKSIEVRVLQSRLLIFPCHDDQH